MSKRYDGPVCFISPDVDAPHDQQSVQYHHVGYRRVGLHTHKRKFKPLKRGWHYSMKKSYKPGLTEVRPGVWKMVKVEDWVPHKPLHLNDSDPANPFYEHAKDHHKSWVEKHGHGTIIRVGT